MRSQRIPLLDLVAGSELSDLRAGDPIRAFLEGRGTDYEVRSGPECLTRRDCGPETSTGYTCIMVSRCGGVTSGIPGTSDEDCAEQQFPTCEPVGGRCVDAEPMCYWNAEVDRVEALPSRLEVVLAEDETDETAVAFAQTGALPLLQLDAANICRSPELGPFSGAPDFSGALGPALGAPIPGGP